MYAGMSPGDLYRLGGGAGTNPRVIALLAEADRGHERAQRRDAWDPEQWEAEHEREVAEEKRLAAELAEVTRPATVEEYLAWLAGYLAAGGRVTHTYDYPFARSSFVVPKPHVTAMYLPDLHGAFSVSLIVPVAVTARLANGFHGCPGHSKVYFMDGFRQVGGIVPVYADVDPAGAGQPAIGDGSVVDGEIVE